jgi:hypothetical protein
MRNKMKLSDKILDYTTKFPEWMVISGLVVGVGILWLAWVSITAYIVMRLWNYVIPNIFNLKELDYWQAFALLVLCKILFKQDNVKTKTD